MSTLTEALLSHPKLQGYQTPADSEAPTGDAVAADQPEAETATLSELVETIVTYFPDTPVGADGALSDDLLFDLLQRLGGKRLSPEVIALLVQIESEQFSTRFAARADAVAVQRSPAAALATGSGRRWFERFPSGSSVRATPKDGTPWYRRSTPGFVAKAGDGVAQWDPELVRQEIVPNEVFRTFLGIDGAPLLGSGEVRLGARGQQLIAMRLMIANAPAWTFAGHHWEGGYRSYVEAHIQREGDPLTGSDRTAFTRQLAADVERIREFFDHVEEVRPRIRDTVMEEWVQADDASDGDDDRLELVTARLDPTRVADYLDDVFERFTSIDVTSMDTLDPDLIRFLILMEEMPQIRAAAQKRLRAESAPLYSTNRAIRDLIYLATFDLATDPDTRINLDASPNDIKTRSSDEEIGAPVVYVIHHGKSARGVSETPTALTQPESYQGLIADHLKRVRGERGELTLQTIFGVEETKQGHRVSATLDTQGRILNAILFEGDAPVVLLLSLESMGLPHLLQINLEYHSGRIFFEVINLSSERTATEFRSIRIDSEVPLQIKIPDVGRTFTFEMSLVNGNRLLTIRDDAGDRLIRVRPHMAQGRDVDRFFHLLEELGWKTPTADDGELRHELQQTFVRMAEMAGEDTRTRQELVRQLAAAPPAITTELLLMMLYQNDDETLERRVHDLAREVSVRWYLDGPFHHVTSYQTVDAGRWHRVGYGTFDDDPETIVLNRSTDDRHVAWVQANETRNPETSIGAALESALSVLNGNGVTEEDVIEVMVRQHIEDDDAFEALLQRIVNERVGDQNLRRVTFIAYDYNGDSTAIPGETPYTFEPTGEGENRYEASMRGVHPLIAERMEIWRLADLEHRYLPSRHGGVLIIEADDLSADYDQSYILNSLVFGTVQPSVLDGTVLTHYILALVSGHENPGVVLESNSVTDDSVPRDLEERLENIFRWALFQRGLIEDPVDVDLQALYETGELSRETIVEICSELTGQPYYAPAVEEPFGRLVGELERLMRAEEGSGTPHGGNRIQLFIESPTPFSEDFVDFLGFAGFHWYRQFQELRLEKAAFHLRAEGVAVSRIVKLRGHPADAHFVTVLWAREKLIEPKTGTPRLSADEKIVEQARAAGISSYPILEDEVVRFRLSNGNIYTREELRVYLADIEMIRSYVESWNVRNPTGPHQFRVTQKGFLFDGREYGDLAEVARLLGIEELFTSLSLGAQAEAASEEEGPDNVAVLSDAPVESDGDLGVRLSDEAREIAPADGDEQERRTDNEAVSAALETIRELIERAEQDDEITSVDVEYLRQLKTVFEKGIQGKTITDSELFQSDIFVGIFMGHNRVGSTESRRFDEARRAISRIAERNSESSGTVVGVPEEEAADVDGLQGYTWGPRSRREVLTGGERSALSGIPDRVEIGEVDDEGDQLTEEIDVGRSQEPQVSDDIRWRLRQAIPHVERFIKSARFEEGFAISQEEEKRALANLQTVVETGNYLIPDQAEKTAQSVLQIERDFEPDGPEDREDLRIAHEALLVMRDTYLGRVGVSEETLTAIRPFLEWDVAYIEMLDREGIDELADRMSFNEYTILRERLLAVLRGEEDPTILDEAIELAQKLHDSRTAEHRGNAATALAELKRLKEMQGVDKDDLVEAEEGELGSDPDVTPTGPVFSPAADAAALVVETPLEDTDNGSDSGGGQSGGSTLDAGSLDISGISEFRPKLVSGTGGMMIGTGRGLLISGVFRSGEDSVLSGGVQYTDILYLEEEGRAREAIAVADLDSIWEGSIDEPPANEEGLIPLPQNWPSLVEKVKREVKALGGPGLGTKVFDYLSRADRQQVQSLYTEQSKMLRILMENEFVSQAIRLSRSKKEFTPLERLKVNAAAKARDGEFLKAFIQEKLGPEATEVAVPQLVPGVPPTTATGVANTPTVPVGMGR